MNPKTALLVVDVQKGMYDTDVLPPIHEGKRTLGNIKALINNARSLNIAVIFIQHCGPEGHPLEKGTENCKIHPEIQPLGNEIIVQKETPDSFYETDLKAQLDKLGITDLVIVGIQTEFCVDTTCRSAFSKGYRTTLIEDSHTTWDTENLSAKEIIKHHNLTLSSWFCETKKCEEFKF